MIHKIIPAPRHLQPYVRFFWTLDSTDTPMPVTLKIFACRFPRLVFQSGNGYSAITIGDSKLPVMFMSGIHTRPSTLTFYPPFTLTGVSFFPLSLKRVFGIDAHLLTDEFPDGCNFAPAWLTEQLLNTTSQPQRIALLAEYITSQLIRNGKGDRMMLEAIRLLTNSTHNTTVENFRSYFNVSERQLERRFKTAIGFNPKQFLRITRFEKSVDMLLSGKFSNLSDIAYHLSYADQSHFIRNFKEFSGFTPLSFINQEKNLEESSSMFVAE